MKNNFLLLLCLFLKSFVYSNYLWLGVEDISDSGAVCPHLALNSRGDAAAIWMKKNNQDFILQSRTKLFGQPWNAPLEISRFNVNNIEHPWKPQVALDLNRNAIAIWCETDAKSTYIVQTSSKNFEQEAWSAPYFLSPEKISEDFHDNEPFLAVDDMGNAIAIWKRTNGVDLLNVLFATKPSGQNWSTGSPFSQEGLQVWPSLIMNPSGYAVAAWGNFRNNYECFMQTSTKSWDQKWSSPIDISILYKDSWFWSYNVGGSESRLAINSNEDAAIVWIGSGENTVYAAEKSRGQEWSSPSYLFYCYQACNPDIAIDPLGNIIAIWIDFEFSGEFIVKAAIKTKGSNWSSPVILSSNLVELDKDHNCPIPYPKINFDLKGNAVVVWTKHINGSSYIQMVTKPVGKEWTVPDDVYSNNGVITNLQMGIDPSQNILLLWEEETLGQSSIRSIYALKH